MYQFPGQGGSLGQDRGPLLDVSGVPDPDGPEQAHRIIAI
jgi:hypothetical protein